jgi:F0F1-type ATP synthase membrane subunit b/b'
LAGIRIKEIGERNNRFFEREMDKLNRWADDRKNSLELELKDLKGQINQVDRQARLAADLQGKLTFQRQKADLERQRKERQRKLYDAEDEIEARKEQLLAEVEQRLRQTVTTKELFTIRWEVV